MTEKQIEFIEKYNFDRNLILTWDVWIWKTFQAKKILSRYENLKKQAPEEYFWLVYEISDARFKEELWSWNLKFRPPSEWWCSIMNYPMECMLKAKVLLYDDIWVSDKTDAYLRKLTFILDHRITKNLPTIFTTNLSPKEIETSLDKRVKSRIFLNSFILEMKWEDRRKKWITII